MTYEIRIVSLTLLAVALSAAWAWLALRVGRWAWRLYQRRTHRFRLQLFEEENRRLRAEVSRQHAEVRRLREARSQSVFNAYTPHRRPSVYTPSAPLEPSLVAPLLLAGTPVVDLYESRTELEDDGINSPMNRRRRIRSAAGFLAAEAMTPEEREAVQELQQSKTVPEVSRALASYAGFGALFGRRIEPPKPLPGLEALEAPAAPYELRPVVRADSVPRLDQSRTLEAESADSHWPTPYMRERTK